MLRVGGSEWAGSTGMRVHSVKKQACEEVRDCGLFPCMYMHGSMCVGAV